MKRFLTLLILIFAFSLTLTDTAGLLNCALAADVTDYPKASGKKVKKSSTALIDYSNASDGYVMVKYLKSTKDKLKAQVTGPTKVTYTYTLKAKEYITFPLSEGNGTYKVTVFKAIGNTSRMSTAVSVSFTAKLSDEFAPFLRPNQYVDYKSSSAVLEKAEELIGDKKDTLDKVSSVYSYVVDNFTYDTQKAKTVQSGYVPDVDEILQKKTGICFDYASVMASMLRANGVPVKLVVGYAGKVYHAWLNVYSEKDGWLDAVIFFDGNSWKLMDPTLASSGHQSPEVLQYIGDSSNYNAKFSY
ncbi:MAG: transglutaminase-like domain-containing protein [Lachnospiraceae bacterium]|nr:transglutaminase-like domain-containing protein [Lachnospiraceae bacterium]